MNRGFTLVEMAVAMVIIGLLITGVLKGQEMIETAKINSTAAEMRQIQSALGVFQKNYTVLPGDIMDPGARFANCTTSPCNRAGDMNGIIGTNVASSFITSSLNTENSAAFAQLAATGLITNISSSPPAKEIGVSNPAVSIGGGFVLFAKYGGDTNFTGAVPVAQGHYIVTMDSVQMDAAAPGVSFYNYKPSSLARLDAKVDDGMPNTGRALAAGSGRAAGTCVINATLTTPYNLAAPNSTCGLMYRVTDF